MDSSERETEREVAAALYRSGAGHSFCGLPEPAAAEAVADSSLLRCGCANQIEEYEPALEKATHIFHWT